MFYFTLDLSAIQSGYLFMFICDKSQDLATQCFQKPKVKYRGEAVWLKGFLLSPWDQNFIFRVYLNKQR